MKKITLTNKESELLQSILIDLLWDCNVVFTDKKKRIKIIQTKEQKEKMKLIHKIQEQII